MTAKNIYSSTIARSSDGTIQITFNIDFKQIKKAKDEIIEKFAKDMEVKGFRRGKAPLDKVRAEIPERELLEKTLANILPKILSELIVKHKIRPAVYPKIELIKANMDEDWQLRAITCELPEIDLGDYKKNIAGLARVKSLWTPDKKSKKDFEGGKPSQEQRQQEVVNYLLDSIKFDLPKILVEDEVNARLAGLLERIEKLGLTLENYLASIGKDVQNLRSEYKQQAERVIKLELILNEIAEKENIKVDDKDIDRVISTVSQKEVGEQKRDLIRSVLRRRIALQNLANLINV